MSPKFNGNGHNGVVASIATGRTHDNRYRKITLESKPHVHTIHRDGEKHDDSWIVSDGQDSCCGKDTALLLRPEWVFQVARGVELFVRSLQSNDAKSRCLDCFLISLPAAQRELEERLLDELRCRLAVLSHQRVGTRAERAQQLIIEEYWKPWTLDGLAREVGCNRTTLQEEFRLLTRTSLHRFLVRYRVSIAERLLTASDVKVSSIARQVGYRSYSAFSRHFKSVTGLTLMTYRVRRNTSAAVRELSPVKRAPSIA